MILIGGALVIGWHIKHGVLLSLAQISWLSFLAIFGSFMFGVLLGYHVLRSIEVQDVYLKDQTITDAKIVMVMSHHTIVYKEKKVYVVRTEDVTKIVGTLAK